MIHRAVKDEQEFLNRNWKGFPHQGDSIMASNTLCLSRAANSFAQQRHITKVFVGFVNEFELVNDKHENVLERGL